MDRFRIFTDDDSEAPVTDVLLTDQLKLEEPQEPKIDNKKFVLYNGFTRSQLV
jgi:hypothetical protein